MSAPRTLVSAALLAAAAWPLAAQTATEAPPAEAAAAEAPVSEPAAAPAEGTAAPPLTATT